MSDLYSFLLEAEQQRDENDVDQGMVCITVPGRSDMFGYVENVSENLLTLHRIKKVANIVTRALHFYPYDLRIPLQHITIARYADSTEIKAAGSYY